MPPARCICERESKSTSATPVNETREKQSNAHSRANTNLENSIQRPGHPIPTRGSPPISSALYYSPRSLRSVPGPSQLQSKRCIVSASGPRNQTEPLIPCYLGGSRDGICRGSTRTPSILDFDLTSKVLEGSCPCKFAWKAGNASEQERKRLLARRVSLPHVHKSRRGLLRRPVSYPCLQRMPLCKRDSRQPHPSHHSPRKPADPTF